MNFWRAVTLTPDRLFLLQKLDQKCQRQSDLIISLDSGRFILTKLNAP